MFKVGNKDTRTAPMVCSRGSIVNFEHAVAGCAMCHGQRVNLECEQPSVNGIPFSQPDPVMTLSVPPSLEPLDHLCDRLTHQWQDNLGGER